MFNKFYDNVDLYKVGKYSNEEWLDLYINAFTLLSNLTNLSDSYLEKSREVTLSRGKVKPDFKEVTDLMFGTLYNTMSFMSKHKEFFKSFDLKLFELRLKEISNYVWRESDPKYYCSELIRSIELVNEIANAYYERLQDHIAEIVVESVVTKEKFISVNDRG